MKKKKYELDTLVFTSDAHVSKWSKIGDIAEWVLLGGATVVTIATAVVSMAGVNLRGELNFNGYRMTTSKQKDALRKMQEQCEENVIED